MNGQELSTHQRGVILRGICNGSALKKKNPEISENNTVITCDSALDIWDICCISSDAEAFGMEAKYHYEGGSRIVFSPTNNTGRFFSRDASQTKVLTDGFVWLVISNEQARQLWETEAFTLYTLYDDGSEGMIETKEDLENSICRSFPIGIEVGFLSQLSNSCKIAP